MIKFTVGAELADAVTRIEFAQFFTLKNHWGQDNQDDRPFNEVQQKDYLVPIYETGSICKQTSICALVPSTTCMLPSN